MKRIAAPLLLLAVLALTVSVFELRGRVPFSSDQALPALMAQDILERGVHPVFYYGAFYGGTVEPHVLAVAFRLLPPSVVTYRLVMAGFLAALVLVTWRTSRNAFGERAGLAAGLYVAAGPSYLLYKGLTSDGAYVSLMLASALAIHFLLEAAEALSGDRDAWRSLTLFGFFSGLAFWIHMPAAFIGPVLAVAMALGPWRRWIEPRALGCIAGGAVTGAFPWIVTNLRWGFPSLSATEAAPADLERIFGQASALVREGWPTLLGGRSVWGGDTFTGAVPVAAAGFVAVILGGLWIASRDPERRTRRAAALLVATIASVSLLTLAMARTDFGEPRYLLCAYVGFAPLVGLLVDRAWRRRRALGAALSTLVLGMNLASEWTAPKLRHRDESRGYWGAYELDGVITALDALGVRSTYASYWTAYRLTFETGGRIRATPYGIETHGITRHPRLCEAVRFAPSHALLLRDEDLAATLRFLEDSRIPYEERPAGPFTLLRGFPPSFGRTLVSCSLQDTSSDSFALIDITLETLPQQVASGSVIEAAVQVRNRSDRWVSPAARLTYRWLSVPDNHPRREGSRSELHPAPGPGATVVRLLSIPADLPPGTYTLVVDLVVENVAWYGDRGGRPFRHSVRITPPR